MFSDSYPVRVRIAAVACHRFICRPRRRTSLAALSGLVAWMVCGLCNFPAAQATTATATALAVTSGSGAVTTVAAGSVVTLTAAVHAGSTAITTGQVNFCDASAQYCTDIHLLGTAQLTSAETAVLKFRPGIGSS